MRLEEINALLSDQSVASDQNKFRELSIEHSQLSPVNDKYKEYLSTIDNINAAKKLLEEEDDDIKEMAEEEISSGQEVLEQLELDLKKALLPKGPNDSRNIIIEIRAGTGGDEASIFFGVPTLYGAILAQADNDRSRVSNSLRLCVSAGEALPEEIGHEWQKRFGVPVLDGLGSTEMLHIFLSNSPQDVRYGTSGRPVPGYDLRIVDEGDVDISGPEIGELLVRGASSASCYWNQRAKSLSTFQGEWTRSGDKYFLDSDGYYHYCGRSDDMLKVGGIWVAPFEVESALLAEERVLEAAVVGHCDDQGLIKPKAIVVLQDGVVGSTALVEELKAFVKQRLAPYKYPRWIEFADELPKTATGKIQRFKLRERPNDDI